MLSIFRRRLNSQFVRSITQSSSTPLATSSNIPSSRSTYPYFLPRNTQGNLPVYSDIRNAGTRHLVLIRNVEGDISALAKELSRSLFPTGSQEIFKMKIRIQFSKHIVISGGRWKNEVMEWLKKKGF